MQGLISYLTENYTGSAVEIGVGRRPQTAKKLVERGFDVTCTDVEHRETPDDVELHVDDVHDPDAEIYRSADVIYSIRPPYELHRPMADVATAVETDLVLKPLGNEETSIDHELVNVEGTTLYVVRNS